MTDAALVTLGQANRRRVVALGSVWLLALAASDAAAQDPPSRFELTPYAGYRFGGSFDDQDGGRTVDLDDNGSIGLIFDIRESANTQWEIVYSQQDTAADTAALSGLAPSTELRFRSLQGGGTYEFDARSGRPYLAVTLGGTRVTPRLAELGSDTFWSMSIGTGLRLQPSGRFGVRLEARLWGTLVDSGASLFCQSGPAGAAYAIEVDGRVLWQVETSAGFVFRF